MLHPSSNEFHAIPRRSARGTTASEIEARLRKQFRPAEQARNDALRHIDDPRDIVSDMRERVDLSRATECAILSNEVRASVTQNAEAAGSLEITSAPEDAQRIVLDATLAYEKVDVENRKAVEYIVSAWLVAKSAFDGWCDRSGGKVRISKFPTWGHTLLRLCLAGFLEFWATSQLMDGQAVAGAVPPYNLGLLFALASVSCGLLGGWGTSLALDNRYFRRHAGFALTFTAFAFWLGTTLLSAHLRACIEAGASGSVADITQSLHRSILRPFVSQIVIILAVASAMATAASWSEWLNHLGRPCGARHEHAELDAATRLVDRAIATFRLAIHQTTKLYHNKLDEFEAAAWKPVHDGRRLEREIRIALGEARESFGAIERIMRGIMSDYAATLRKLRPGIDIASSARLSVLPIEQLGDPGAVQEIVAELIETASSISEAVAEARVVVRKLEITALQTLELRFSRARSETERAEQRRSVERLVAGAAR